MARLVVCGACARHVHETEDQCPFCDAELARAPRVAAAPGLSRAAQYAARAFASANVAALVAGGSACSDEARSPADLPPGGDASATSATVTPSVTGTSTAPPTSPTAVATTTTTSTAPTTATATATATGVGTGVVQAGGVQCGAGTCPPGQFCFHPCAPCGGMAARVHGCPPDPPPTCRAGTPQDAQVQAGHAYQMCPAMPYGCVFPDDCGRVTV